MSDKKKVPGNIEELRPYVPGKTIEEVVKEFKPAGIAKLASNENRLGYSSDVSKAILEASEVVNNYPDPQSLRLKEAISKRLNINPDQLVVASGSESLLSILCRTFFEGEDELLTSEATFVGMIIQANVQNIPVIQIPLANGYRFDVDAMISAVTEKTKMIYIANPNNPTGTYITKIEFDRLMDAVPDDVLVVMDEAYYEFAEEVDDYPDTLSANHENLIILRTFSKGYGLAGFRIGYGIAHPDIITYMNKTKLTFEPGALSQAAALAAWNDQDFLERSKNMVKEGKSELYKFFELNSVSYIPSVTNFVMVEFQSEIEAENFTLNMMKEGVILRWLRGFGLSNCVRITIGTKEENLLFKRSFNKILA